MKKSQLVDALTRIPGDPEIRLALRIGDDFDEDALCTIAGDSKQVTLYPRGFKEFLRFWGIAEEDEPVIYAETNS